MSELLLVCRVNRRLCGLRLEAVRETCRPLPVEKVGSGPDYILGLTCLRGQITPVVDVARLLGDASAPIGRYVTVKLPDARLVALAVTQVEGIREAPALSSLPRLLEGAPAEAVGSLTMRDPELLVLLDLAAVEVPAA